LVIKKAEVLTEDPALTLVQKYEYYSTIKYKSIGLLPKKHN